MHSLFLLQLAVHIGGERLIQMTNKLLKHRVVGSVLATQELKEIVGLSKILKRHCVVAGYSDFLHQQLVLFRGDSQTVIVPFAKFEPSGTCSPDFNELEIIDYGNTIRLGEYEADVLTVI
jgi:hypothetical protein